MSQLAFFLVILAGAFLGMLPYVAFLGSLVFAAVYAGACLLVVLTLAVWYDVAKNEPLRLAEYSHAVLGGAAYSATTAYTGFLLYGFGYALTYAIGAASNRFQLGWEVNPGTVAFWASAPITLLFNLLMFSFSPIPRTLNADATGVVSAYDSLLRDGTLSWAVPAVLGAAALSVLTYFFWAGSWWLDLIAVFSIMAAGSGSMRVATKWSPKVAVGREAVQALEKLYGILGYDTVVSPRTKDSSADVDSLLRRVDIFASSDHEAFVIAVPTPGATSPAVSAADASILPTAARVMSRYLRETSQSQVQVQPVLILVGRKPTEDLALLAEDERIRVLSLPEEVVREVLKTEDETALRQLALQYLLAGSAISTPSSSSTTASVAS